LAKKDAASGEMAAPTPSALAWVDADHEARRAALSLISALVDKRASDELGFGVARDGLADLLFPGTSTLQTHLRYMLFIPWLYLGLEARLAKNPLSPAANEPSRLSAMAAKAEFELTSALANSEPAGVIGSSAGIGIRRPASSIYWAGLSAWGVSLRDWPQRTYLSKLPSLAKARSEANRRLHADDSDHGAIRPLSFWHDGLPKAPEGFPKVADFDLLPDEAEFLRARLSASHPESLFAWLANRPFPLSGALEWPWELADLPWLALEPAHLELLEQARRFSIFAHLATLCYQHQLASLLGDHELAEELRGLYRGVLADGALRTLSGWDPRLLWDLLAKNGRVVDPGLRVFISEWLARALSSKNPMDDPEARLHVEKRERLKKPLTSRFASRRALENWGRSALVHGMAFRWPVARTYLAELFAALPDAR
jgi:hypothetical protein